MHTEVGLRWKSRREAGEARSSAGLCNRKDDLAEVPVRPHVFERGNALLQRKASIDRHSQPPGFERGPQIRLHTAVDLRHLGDAPCPEGNADIGESLQRVQIEIERR